MTRSVGGAHYGLRDWLIQRVTAVFMTGYALFLVGLVLYWRPLGYARWKALFDQPWMRYATLLFFLGLCLHAWVGVRDILMDYVPVTAIRLFFHVLAIMALLVYSMWAVRILWSNGI